MEKYTTNPQTQLVFFLWLLILDWIYPSLGPYKIK